MKKYRRFLERRLKDQHTKERKDKTLEKVKIIPPKLRNGIKEYNP